MVDVNSRQASYARVYDYLLGGKDNLAVDRELAEQLIALAPETAWIVRENRAFLGRAVRYCAEQGVRQFVDLGSGLPTQNNVHEVAQRVDPGCRVVYVDNDPVVVNHALAILAGGAGTTAIRGDLRAPAEVTSHRDVVSLIDFSRPVAVLMVSVLDFVIDLDAAKKIVGHFARLMAPGSFLVLAHGTHEVRPEAAAQAEAICDDASVFMVTRSKRQIESLFTGLDLVGPGLVFTSQWRPTLSTRSPARTGIYAGVARKPGPDGAGPG